MSTLRNKISLRSKIGFIVVPVLFLTVMGSVWIGSRYYVLQKAEKDIQTMLLQHKGVHHYVQRLSHPELYTLKEGGRVAESLYTPILFSSSYMVRNMHNFYNEEREKSGLSNLYYKMAAENPRNPVNQADAFETELIRMFNEEDAPNHFRKIEEKDGQEYLYVAIPFLRNQKRCLKCHGDIEDAPIQLQQRYPEAGGYNEKEGYIRAIESLRAPLGSELTFTYITMISSSVVFVIVFSLLLLNRRLDTLVAERTQRLQDRTKELAQSEERLNLSVEGADIGLWDWDMLTDNVYFSPRYLSMLGYEHNELPHTLSTWEELLHPDDKEKAQSQVGASLKEKNPQWSIEARFRHKDGSYRWILGMGKVVEYDEKGKQIRAAGTHLDINDSKQAQLEKARLESELSQSQKMEAIGTLSGGIAHDFNNILTVIMGSNELSRNHMDKPDKLQRDIDRIHQGATRAKELVQQILTFSRKAEQNKQLIQVAPLIKEGLKLLRSTIPTTIEIKEDLNCSALTLADPTQIHQILMNLCTNAYHSMRESGGILGVRLQRVELSGYDNVLKGDLQPGTYIRLEVSDTGTGMDKETQKKIYNPYYTTKDKGDGTGLGLAVVHGIVKDYHGTICVYSEVGVGTTFHVYLPILEEIPEPSQASPEKNTVTRGTETIMIVDDEEAIRDVMNEALTEHGYRVVTFSNAAQALHHFSETPDNVDLIVTDMTMPEMTGHELAVKALEVRQDIPLILCTGHSEIIGKEEAEEIGIKEFLQKPVAIGLLLEKIRITLDSNRPSI